MSQLDTVFKFLGYLNLDMDESKVYISLLEKGEMTILQISRAKKISRTNVYRIVDRLVSRGLITESSHGKKRFFSAVGIDQLEILVKEEETRVEYLKNIFPELSSIIPNEKSLEQLGTRVKMYQGEHGISKILRNSLEAGNEIVGYTFKSIQDLASKEFALEWMQECSFKGIVYRDIVTENFLNSLKNNSLNSQIPTFKNETRHITRQKLLIQHQMYVYNDVVSYVHLKDGKILGIEIYDEKLALFHKQIFELLWERAQRV